MTTAAAGPSAALVQEIDALAGQLDAARGIVATGELVDLQGLDAEVDRLCRAVQALPRSQGTSTAASLKRLLDCLERLKGEVRLQQDVVTQQLKGVSARKQAVSAYGRAPLKPRR